MPGALGDVLDAIQTGLSQLPPAAYVVGLLFGPTAAWIGYRLYTAPKTAKPERELGDLYWVCTECRSVNEVRDRRCYHCATDRDAIPGALHVIDHDQLLQIEEVPVEPDPLDQPFDPGTVAEPAPAPALVPVMDAKAKKPAAKRPRAPRAKRPPVAVPIEPEDDVLAASHTVSATTGSDGGR